MNWKNKVMVLTIGVDASSTILSFETGCLAQDITLNDFKMKLNYDMTQ